MNQYELLYIIPAKHTEKEIAGLIEKINGLLTDAGAVVSATHDLGKRKLAYAIDHVRFGHYVLVHYDAEGAVTQKLNQMLRLSTDILRHLTVVRDPHIKGIPSFTEDEAPKMREEAPVRAKERRIEAKGDELKEKAENMTMEELDKKLDTILTEDVA